MHYSAVIVLQESIIYFSVFFFLQKGQTPLHYAAQNDHSQVVAVFLKHKPDVMMQQNAVSSVLATGSPRLTNKFVVQRLILICFSFTGGQYLCPYRGHEGQCGCYKRTSQM